MTRLDLIERIKNICVELSGQTVEAAHYVINNAEEIPFYTMREVARRAEVQPVSLVRLAQRLGFAGYSEFRQQFIDTTERHLRDRQSIKRNELSAQTLISESGKTPSLMTFVDSFFATEQAIVGQARLHLSEEQLEAAIEILAKAPKIYVMGRRTAFTPAFTLAYTLQKARPNIVLLDTPGGAPEGALDDIHPGDAFVAVTFAPFNRLVHRLTEKASHMGARVIAITDSFAAPISKFAGPLHFVAQSSGRAFPESALGAIAIANALAALTIIKLGDAAQHRIRENERFLVNSGEYLLSSPDGKRQRTPKARRTNSAADGHSE
ncbi:RpiR family transcriptional regulator [Rhizobium sp. N122]|uniref:MurR/RpiR family transcriptional regulator n=1 Tax=Rhizobium sp. N122 TaxID=1764272 RepID=UPI000B5A80FE|nr:MurR/RpiR family transcriptional regulator [Rhizobium sp. N122]OWV85820.1 RpiR family transcriptional regulator [Rhizobium sp. N122]